MASLVEGLFVGALQGIFEWLPISSEGTIAIVLAALGFAPEAAVGFSLSLHLGTAVSATAYYRDELQAIAREVPCWRPGARWEAELAELTFLGIGTLVSGLVGVTAYALLLDAATAVAGGVFIAVVGLLLIATGLLQRVASTVGLENRAMPGLVDAVLVGVGQGLAILPGVSRSGTTVSVLLLRGHDGERSFRLSFLLSIPAAIGGGLIAFLEGDVSLAPLVAGAALGTSAVVGYLTIDALLRLVRRVAFWAVCVGLGAVAVVGGAVAVLV